MVIQFPQHKLESNWLKPHLSQMSSYLISLLYSGGATCIKSKLHSHLSDHADMGALYTILEECYLVFSILAKSGLPSQSLSDTGFLLGSFSYNWSCHETAGYHLTRSKYVVSAQLTVWRSPDIIVTLRVLLSSSVTFLQPTVVQKWRREGKELQVKPNICLHSAFENPTAAANRRRKEEKKWRGKGALVRCRWQVFGRPL